MNLTSIQVEHLSKSYRQYKSGWHRLWHWLGLPYQVGSQITILENINFQIQQGESVALVGQNGAGKSTLLKMIANTLTPSTGQVVLQGKIAAILELGMGFNPEFTGRQNAEYVLAMMGYSAEQAESVMPAIHAFSEIGDYFDQPIRIYSSGMQMRVAFAVATAFRPDVLIIDEALSVGDTYFQHKSFAKIREFKEQGTTLLFVSHDKSAILTLCDRAILIDKGTVAMDDNAAVVMDFYNALIAQKEEDTIVQNVTEQGHVQTHSGTQQLVINSVELQNASGKATDDVLVGEALCLQVKVKANQAMSQVVLGFSIKDRTGQTVFGTNSFYLQKVLDFAQGDEKTYRIQFSAMLGEGSYSVTLALHQGTNHLASNIHWLDYAVVLNVHNRDYPAFVGNAFIASTIEVLE
jgi:lipopolysaccharide transport system ATP-binding protein